MAFSLIKFLKGIVITEEGTLTPREVEILPGGAANTKTTIQASQTANQTITLPDATDTLVGKATTDTLTSKSIDATTNTLTNISNSSVAAAAAIDATKLGNGDVDNTELSYVSGVTSSIQTQLTTNSTSISNHTSATSAHGTAGTVVGTTDAQTLTNKTIDASNNTLTNIDVAASTNLATVTTLDEATTNTASTINIGTGTGANVVNIGGANSTVNITGNVNNNNVTNLNVTDKLITINDGGGAGSGGNSGFEIQEAGSPTGYFHTSTDRNSFEFKAPNTAGVVALTPGAIADNVVLASAQQMLLNKDIDGATASNVHRITVPKETLSNLQALTRKEATVVYGTDTQKMYVDNGTSLVPVGTGGVKNYFPSGDAESGMTMTTYADGTSSPVDGQGGSPTLVAGVSSVDPLAGTKSFTLTTGSLGNGVSILSDTIDVKDRGGVFTLEFNVSRTSGGSGLTGNGEFGLYILDVTNSNQQVMLSPTFNVPALGLNSPQTLKLQVQIPINSSQLRFCLHQQISIGTAYDLKFEFGLTQQAFAGYAPIKTDFISYTPTFTTVTASNIEIKYAIDGELLKVFGRFTHTGGTGALTMTLPLGKVIKSTDVAASNYRVCGTGGFTTTTQGSVTVLAQAGLQTLAFGFDGTTSNAPYTGVWGSETMTFFAEVPIEGQSSQSQVISEYDGRVVAAKYLIADGVTTNGSTPLNAATKVYDSHNSVTTGSGWKFTAPVAGKYQISLHAYFGSGNEYIYVYKNGTKNTLIGLCYTATLGAGTVELELNVGDYVDIRGNASITTAGSQGSYASIGVSLLSGAQQILAGQRIFSDYYLSTNQALTANVTAMIFDTKINDTVGSYNTSNGKYTAFVNGDVLICGDILTTAGSSGFYFKKFTSGGSVIYGKYLNTSSTSAGGFSQLVSMNAGEYLQIFSDNNITILGGSASGPVYYTTISFKQVN